MRTITAVISWQWHKVSLFKADAEGGHEACGLLLSNGSTGKTIKDRYMEIITLSNRARIVYERTDFVKSMTCGIYVAAGSRFEKKEEAGVSHFIEHMLFKGTKRHSGAELSEEFDLLGGNSDAYTTKEMTSFYAKALGDKAGKIHELLTEMISEPKFDENDIENERGVILEEIGMYEDDPEDLAIERLSEKIYPGNALGRPILGSRKTVGEMNRERLTDYMKHTYVGSNIVASLCGNFDLKEIDRLARKLEVFPEGKKSAAKEAIYRPSLFVRRKAYEQNHFCLIFPSFSAHHPDRRAAALLSSILGGGPSSRLFRRLREDEGLCYSVYAFTSCSVAEGIFGIYTATNPESENRAILAIWEELDRLVREGVTQQELDRAREKNRTSFLMGMESTGNRSEFMGRSLIYYDRVASMEESEEAYRGITREDIQRLAQEIFQRSLVSFSAVGRVKKEAEYRCHCPI